MIYPHYRSDVVEMFQERDKDLSGSMSFEEFCGHETRNELAFKAIDKNGDGYISKKEFRRICPKILRGTIRTITATDHGRYTVTVAKYYTSPCVVASRVANPDMRVLLGSGSILSAQKVVTHFR